MCRSYRQYMAVWHLPLRDRRWHTAAMEHNEALLRDLEAIVSKHKPTAAELGAAVADLLYYAGIDGRPNLADAFTVLGKARDARAVGR
jgi:hypothetical protein